MDIRELLAATDGFALRLADAGDVQLQVDGTTFEPDVGDPSTAMADCAGSVAGMRAAL